MKASPLAGRRLLTRLLTRTFSQRACTSAARVAVRRVSDIPHVAARAAATAFKMPASVLLLTISIALPVLTFAAAFSAAFLAFAVFCRVTPCGAAVGMVKSRL